MSGYNKIDTKLIHAGEPEPKINGAVSMPIFQSATFEYGGESSYHDVRYVRLNNTPNHLVLNAKLRALENAEAAMVTSSGMAAISTTLLTLLGNGDHLLAQNCLYGGTHSLVTSDLADYGIRHDFINHNDPDSWPDKLSDTTKVIYVESMTNPLLEVADLKKVVAFARKHGLISLIDNTFTSPFNFRPAEVGFDISLHSCTKYLNGHADIAAGAIIGKAELVDKITHRLNHFGGTLDPHACFLLHRGMKTLALRMRQHNSSALKIARFLQEHPRVTQVNHPGLKSHPDHERARQLFDGFSGMLSFQLDGGTAEAETFMKRVKLAINAPSLGGVESLLTIPAQTSHAGLSPDERERIGISDSLIRMSVGIEDTDELIADLDQALRI